MPMLSALCFFLHVSSALQVVVELGWLVVLYSRMKASRMILVLLPHPCLDSLSFPSIDISMFAELRVECFGGGKVARRILSFLPVHLESALHLRVEVGGILSLVACDRHT